MPCLMVVIAVCAASLPLAAATQYLDHFMADGDRGHHQTVRRLFLDKDFPVESVMAIPDSWPQNHGNCPIFTFSSGGAAGCCGDDTPIACLEEAGAQKDMCLGAHVECHPVGAIGSHIDDYRCPRHHPVKCVNPSLEGCSIADGTGPSASYPCTCGGDVCSMGQVCDESTHSCSGFFEPTVVTKTEGTQELKNLRTAVVCQGLVIALGFLCCCFFGPWLGYAWHTLAKKANDARTEADEARTLVEALIVKALDKFEPSSGIEDGVLKSALEVAWMYSLNGVEGHRAGHILVVGKWAEIQPTGHLKGRNFWSKQSDTSIWINEISITEECRQARKLNQKDLIKTMNFNGATVIDCSKGNIVANNFFANKIAEGKSGGAGEAAARQLSSLKDTVSFKISADGFIKEFRQMQPFKEHCSNRPTITTVTKGNNQRG